MKKNIAHIEQIYTILQKEVQTYKVPVVELMRVQTKDPFKILVTTILSARTNDATTAEAAKRLFDKVNTIIDLETLSTHEIEQLIFPVGFYKNKARFLKELPIVLKTKFQGNIPQTIDELIQLPGVGRKTANLVMSVAFEKPAICVDIHVHRITNRIGMVKTSTPLETEMELRKILPEEFWKPTNAIFVPFGQFLCRPVNPKCNQCPIYHVCSRNNVQQKKKKLKSKR